MKGRKDMLKSVQPFIIGALVILLLVGLFKLLIYAIPVLLVVWAGSYAIKKIKSTKMFKRKPKETEIEDVKPDIFNSGNIFNGQVVDVEYEEIKK